MNKLELAHDRAVVAVLNAIDCDDEQAVEIVDSIAALVLITLDSYLPEDHHDDKFN